MRTIKHFFAAFLASVLLLTNTNGVFAADLAGDDEFICCVLITITDESGGYSGDGFKVLLKDVTGTAENEFDVTSTDWKQAFSKSLMLPAPTTYNITFEGLEDGYVIVNTKSISEEISRFAAADDILELNWAIMTTQQYQEELDALNAPKPDSSFGKLVKERKGITITNQDAENAYLEFLDAVSFIEDDPSWSEHVGSLLCQYGKDSVNRTSYSGYFAKYVAGGSEEEYFSMTSFEQFVWTETYTKLASTINGGWGFSHYYADKKTFKNNYTRYLTPLMTGDNNEVVIEAYLKLMDWQFEYITANGVPFNFIRNRSYMDELEGLVFEVDDSKNNTGNTNNSSSSSISKTDDSVVSQDDSSLNEESQISSDNSEEDDGIWDAVFSSLADNAVSILILAVLIAIFVILNRIRKSKNMDEMNQ